MGTCTSTQKGIDAENPASVLPTVPTKATTIPVSSTEKVLPTSAGAPVSSSASIHSADTAPVHDDEKTTTALSDDDDTTSVELSAEKPSMPTSISTSTLTPTLVGPEEPQLPTIGESGIVTPIPQKATPKSTSTYKPIRKGGSGTFNGYKRGGSTGGRGSIGSYTGGGSNLLESYAGTITTTGGCCDSPGSAGCSDTTVGSSSTGGCSGHSGSSSSYSSGTSSSSYSSSTSSSDCSSSSSSSSSY